MIKVTSRILWGIIEATIFAIMLLPASTLPNEAATYYVDAFAGGVAGTGGGYDGNVCEHQHCLEIIETPVHQFSPGDVVDFGSVTLYDSTFGGIYGYDEFLGYLYIYGVYTGGYNVSYDGSGFVAVGYGEATDTCNTYDPNCPSDLPTSSFTVPLVFTVGSSGYIQLGWTDAYDYSPPVAPTPLPTTLLLFASGLGAFGLLGWRRKRKNAAAIAA
jgi:hypothetical protein